VHIIAFVGFAQKCREGRQVTHLGHRDAGLGNNRSPPISEIQTDPLHCGAVQRSSIGLPERAELPYMRRARWVPPHWGVSG
jgi:hypothetical protein